MQFVCEAGILTHWTSQSRAIQDLPAARASLLCGICQNSHVAAEVPAMEPAAVAAIARLATSVTTGMAMPGCSALMLI